MDPCPVCRWSARHVTKADLGGTLRSIAGRWRWTVEGLTPSDLSLAPTGGASLDDIGRSLLEVLGGTPEPSLQAGLDDACRAADAALRVADDRSDLHAVAHQASHRLTEAGRIVAALGRGASPSSGAVAGVHVSDSGVPKLPVDHATISLRGLSGDRQGERRHHGRLWQAVSLWSVEVIDRLRAEGHDVRPGAAGENLTLSGLDWSTVRVGTRLRIGPTAVLDVASWASPCRKIAHCFAGRDFSRVDHDRHPGWARAYASVVHDGEVRPGDEALVEPQFAAFPTAIGRSAG